MDTSVLDEDSAAPIKPVAKCKRCGCWLRALRTTKTDEDVAQREYCSACEAHMAQHGRPCGMCGEVFFTDDAGEIRCPDCEAEYQEEKRTCNTCGRHFLPYACGACDGKPAINDVCHACHWRDVHAKEASARESQCRVCGCRFLPRTCIVPECKARLSSICSVCHEEEVHAGMVASVWTLPDCVRCESVIAALKGQHRRIARKSLERLVSGAEPDIDAMAHLAITGGLAPLVHLDGRFLEPDEVEALIS